MCNAPQPPRVSDCIALRKDVRLGGSGGSKESLALIVTAFILAPFSSNVFTRSLRSQHKSERTAYAIRGGSEMLE